MKARPFVLSWILCAATAVLPAATVPDRKGAVLNDRLSLVNDARWIYNDHEKGFAEARRTGKPLLIVLRCVPCLGCSSLDARVLLDNSDLDPLLSRFVRVRVINANALDLARFQFDYDLSFSAMFFNGDGTVYGRFSSWAHQVNTQDATTTGFQKALLATLELHQNYPANQAQLAGKQGLKLPFNDPLQIPELAGKYRRELDWEGKVVQSCVHCHQIGDALRSFHRKESQPMPVNLIYPWPAPETIGVSFAPDHIARVQSVEPGSIAARAGLRVGDDLVSLDGQPLISSAEVSWCLHRITGAGTLAAVIRRDGAEQTVPISLPEGWRLNSDISRRVGTWGMRAMALGGLYLEDLANEERTRRGLDEERMALLIKHAGEYGEHAAAKKAGFQKDDVIIELEGRSARVSESRLIGDLLLKHRPGAKVKAVVLRGGERVELSLPIQ